MIRGLDTLRQNIDVLLKRQENASSNIANVNTTGYQAKKLFQSTLKQVRFQNYQGGPNVNQRTEIGDFTFGNQLDGAALNPEKGAFKQTGRSTDFAIQNDGYFTVKMPNGTTAYTRNGNFKVNAQNEYVTQEGYQVLSAAGTAVAAGQNPAFGIVAFDNPQQLESQGNTYYTTTQTPHNVQTAQVLNGYLEQSNVATADEMVSLIQTGREFEANQKALSTNNETLNKAVNELGKI
ncbi:flagellar hook-basal body protein [Liquorilactobacillus satsumensis]|uniref:Flagellar basal-body rod protein n=2 Tax=Liquorilactobacillus satsumensis TaxID=259059 RepID=A0A0R1VB82_9LACO|nr:flagellar hook-basal body protein [Liquorilactobacillus satsumensis]AJA34300.1 flagellar basal-body rod protein FlgF [Liquorilactobacillus satsumensis]KRL99147.1 flagellar basal-body rod protein [Liquorilactobacillus satsumensis DSM 16230 = JCM 12392]MCP9312862.1 flagellar hook-basal body protein [Liquorilactobacillus satsumensis]MCP9329271.1 flagellar hook-basal body protein [Liquorilactobacillus satsumensis]MCP9357832.1 flagellar hook-basal body protein [Liquorilactobacillus satsumensis]